jgi:integrase
MSHRQFFGDNPARWKETQQYLFPLLPKTAAEHFPGMPYESLPEFIRTLRQYQNNSVAAVALEFLIYTAARRDEVRLMVWSEVDFETRVWTIPAERMEKGKREHTVPLSDRAIEILKRRKEHTVGPYVFFAYQRREPLDEKAMYNILNGIVTGYTVHGFRTSFSKWANETTEHPWDLIEECLSHQVGSVVRRAYNRRTRLEKRRVLMAEWAAYCDGSLTSA